MRMRNKTDKRSAGIIVFRFARRSLEILLIHPGGSFWGKKDEGSWSIPKGIYENDEEPLTAARREFQEETGFIADGEFLALQLPFMQVSESMGNHDSKIVDAASVD